MKKDKNFITPKALLVVVPRIERLTDEENAEMLKIENEYLEEIKTNRGAGSLPKYKKYWEYVMRCRHYN